MKSILGGLVVEFGIKKCNFDVLFAAYKWRVQACYIETNVIDFAYTFIYHVSVFGRHYIIMAHLDSESINFIQVDVNHISLQNRT